MASEKLDIEEIHYGREGPHWAVVPMKKFANRYSTIGLRAQSAISALSPSKEDVATDEKVYRLTKFWSVALLNLKFDLSLKK